MGALAEEQIPNSYYMPFGEGVYAGMDDEGSTTLKLTSIGMGTFTLNLSRGDEASSTTLDFIDIPVFIIFLIHN